MKRIVVVMLMSVIAFGCGSKKAVPFFTEDFWGKPLVVQEVQREESRKQVPVGVEPDDVVAIVKTASGAAAYITKTPKRHLWSPQKYEAAMNEQAQAEGMVVTRPKGQWIVKWMGIFVLIGAAIAIIRYIVLWILGRNRR